MKASLCLSSLLLLPALFAQAPRVEAVIDQACASCHERGLAGPDRAVLRKMTPEAIYQSLNTGSMRAQATSLNDATRRAISEYLGGRKLGIAAMGDAKVMSNRCPANPPLGDLSAKPSWNGWSADAANTRFQSAAGLTADQTSRLKLKWAFGFPGATSVYGQPSIAGGRVFVGADSGFVYSLDAASGCVYWSFLADSGVRTAVSIGPVGSKHAAYFGDMKGNAYAVDAASGALLWKVAADEHPTARITGAPKLYEGRLYVPVASAEEPVAGLGTHYPCCTFRGSVVALDAATGRQIWKTYIIPEAPKPVRKTDKGVQLWAPAGGGVWNSPTIDPKRKAMYIGTGDAYTQPASKFTDSVMALNLADGKVLWSVQDTENDAWLVGCGPENANCPKDVGPDYDFGSSPILKNLPNGKSILVAGQKSGMIWAHDPDRKGAVVWKTSLASKAPGPGGQVVWGGAADELNAYFGMNSGGVAALQLKDGERKWFAPLDPAPGSQYHGNDAAVSALPGVVLTGGWDGMLRALSAANGSVLWEYNVAQEFKTVNGVAAKGGSIGSAGPTIAGGMVFAGAGYPGVQNGMPGNALLAFSVE